MQRKVISCVKSAGSVGMPFDAETATPLSNNRTNHANQKLVPRRILFISIPDRSPGGVPMPICMIADEHTVACMRKQGFDIT
jgi:hypothetical protein